MQNITSIQGGYFLKITVNVQSGLRIHCADRAKKANLAMQLVN